MFDQLKMLGQMGPLMAKAREMQSKMGEVQSRLPNLRAQGSAGGGMVTATASGSMEIVGLNFTPEALKTDPELLADMTRAAVNLALRNMAEQVQKEMHEVTGGMDMGALKGLLGG